MVKIYGVIGNIRAGYLKTEMRTILLIILTMIKLNSQIATVIIYMEKRARYTNFNILLFLLENYQRQKDLWNVIC